VWGVVAGRATACQQLVKHAAQLVKHVSQEHLAGMYRKGLGEEGRCFLMIVCTGSTVRRGELASSRTFMMLDSDHEVSAFALSSDRRQQPLNVATYWKGFIEESR